MHPSQVVEFSSYVGTAQRAAHLARFKSGSATVLVASDAMTRGMDVEHVANVINYDAPVYVKTYVHRWAPRLAGFLGKVLSWIDTCWYAACVAAGAHLPSVR